MFSADRFAPDVARAETAVVQFGRPSFPKPQHLSATGRSIVPFNTPGYETLITTLKEEASGRRNAGHAFTRIDVHRISLGLDVRTTVMLRNIPNRVTSPMLKRIIDETSLGNYDFMYLRIGKVIHCIHEHN
jgi:hypothetical protein